MAGTGKNSGFTKAPDNVKIDDRVVKKLAGEALAGVKGVLGLKGGITDLLKDYSDPTRGLTVVVTENQEVSVTAKIITEEGQNIPAIVIAATDAITGAMQNTAGLKVKDICVEVVDTMTREAYQMETSNDLVFPADPTMM